MIDRLPQGGASAGYGINDAGDVIGFSQPAGAFHATLWSGLLDDLALDFGDAYGLWTVRGASAWQQVHGRSPAALAVGNLDGNGFDDLIVDFGPPYGVWAWRNHATWTFLHPFSPTQIVTGDLDGNGRDEMVFDFPGYGLWACSWPTSMAADPTTSSSTLAWAWESGRTAEPPAGRSSTR